MASQYGVNTVTSANAARPIRVQSSTPIGVVGTVLLPANADTMSVENKKVYEKIKANEPLFFGSADKALEFFEDMEGTIRESLDGIADQNVSGPIIINAVEIELSHSGKVAEEFYNDLTMKTKIIKAIGELKGVAAEVDADGSLTILRGDPWWSRKAETSFSR